MEFRYFVYRKKEGHTRFTHTRQTFCNKEEAIAEANKYEHSYIEKVTETGKEVERIQIK